MNTAINFFPEGKMKLKGGILFVEYKTGILIDENVLYRQIMCRKNLTNNQNFFMLVDLRNNVEVTDDAIALAAANPNSLYVKAIAMIAKPGVDYARVKLYSIFDDPNIKTRAFLSIEEAKAWFESIDRENYLRKAS